jgi:hypothetical protein
MTRPHTGTSRTRPLSPRHTAARARMTGDDSAHRRPVVRIRFPICSSGRTQDKARLIVHLDANDRGNGGVMGIHRRVLTEKLKRKRNESRWFVLLLA